MTRNITIATAAALTAGVIAAGGWVLAVCAVAYLDGLGDAA